MSAFGIHAENVTFDFEKIFEYKEETTKQLVSGVEGLFKGNEVDQISGKGTLLPDKKVKSCV